MKPKAQAPKDKALPETFFAPAARAGADALRKAVAVVGRNPIVDTMLQSFGSLVAVLNEERQILAVNDALLAMMGIENAGEALGLRPGEAAGCVHAAEAPGGCGTSRYCSTCGAAVAIVTARRTGRPEERDCVLTVARDGRTTDIDFEVRCAPVELDGLRLLLLFMRNTTAEKWRGALERTFFHDIRNHMASLIMATDLLASVHRHDDAVRIVRESVAILAKEVDVQQALSSADPRECPVTTEGTSVCRVLDKIRGIFATHPAAAGVTLRIVKPPEDVSLTTDPGLLLRAVMNMVTNALEATPPGQEARVWTQAAGDKVTFLVWNPRPIPPDVALRVFQRYFSTKAGYGRGLGTFAMRWVAEKYLKGSIDFTSTEAEGTTFRLTIPQNL